MKILRVISTMNPTSGGPCQGIRNSIPQLNLLGVPNEVVCLDEANSFFLKNDTFLIHALGSNKGKWNYSKQLVPWLKDHLVDYDIVIVHGLWLYIGYAVRKALKELKKDFNRNRRRLPKVYVMPHGMLDPYFQKDKGRKLKAIRNWIYWKFIESKLVNSADGLLFTCEEELLLARKSFSPYKPKKEINTGYGIPQPAEYSNQMQEEFQAKCPEVKTDKFILFLGRIHEKKGVDILISAYNTLINSPATVSGTIPKLVIAGPGLESEYGQKLKMVVEKSESLKRSVFFIGMVTGNAKWGALYGCEAFILPSHQENFGIAVVEALACSKPVLLSNKVNIWREIVNAQAGAVAEDTEAGITSMLLSWHIMSDKNKKEYSDNAYNLYKLKFAIESAAKQMIDGLATLKTSV